MPETSAAKEKLAHKYNFFSSLLGISPLPIAVARLLPGQLQQRLTQLRVAVRPGLVSIARPLQAQQLAGRALAQPELGGDERHVAS